MEQTLAQQKPIAWARVVPAAGLTVAGLALIATNVYVGVAGALCGFLALHLALRP